MSKTVGRLASLVCAAGVISFFIGLFGGPRSMVIIGAALMSASLIGFFIEEQGNRKARA